MTLAQVLCMYLCDFLHAIMMMRGREKGVLCVYSRLFREKVGLRSSAGTPSRRGYLNITSYLYLHLEGRRAI